MWGSRSAVSPAQAVERRRSPSAACGSPRRSAIAWRRRAFSLLAIAARCGTAALRRRWNSPAECWLARLRNKRLQSPSLAVDARRRLQSEDLGDVRVEVYVL